MSQDGAKENPARKNYQISMIASAGILTVAAVQRHRKLMTYEDIASAR